MRRPKTVGLYFLVIALIAAALCVVFNLLLPNPLSTAPVGTAQPTAGLLPTSFLTPSGGGGGEPLTEIDKLLQQAMSGSLAYNAPDKMNTDDTVTIELLLSPSLSEEELKKQITEPGTVLSSGDVKITEQMEAKIVSQDPDAFTIQALQEPRQLISNLEPTKWSWYVTAKKSGKQKLTVAVYRVIEFEGERLTRIVKEYESDIDVKITPQRRLRSLWPVLPLILLLGAIAAAGFIYGKRRKKAVRAGASRRDREGLGNIFTSYRRSDSADIVGRIYDSLVDEFGRERIFKDVDSIPLGVDFKQYLDQKVSECKVLLAVIGDEWDDARDAQGNRRLDDPDDFVRIEIESALERDIPVIPLLVRGAQMPTEVSLPPTLQKLVYKNGLSIRPDPDFHHDMDRLISALDKYIQPDYMKK